MNRYVASTLLPVKQSVAFAYHERPGALQRLIPPWQQVTIESSDGSLRSGSRVVMKLHFGPASVRWVAEHCNYDPPNLFADRQVSGPFDSWLHRHEFHPAGDDTCRLTDRIDYEVPGGSVGQFFASGKARCELERMFAYRHRITRDDLELVRRYPTLSLTVAVSGSSGLVGQKLCALLTLLGHQVIRLERSAAKAQDDPNALAPWSSRADAEKLSQADAVVHLAGKPIADQRWTDEVKRQIRDSRVELTGQLAASLAALETKPRVLVCASAVGIYGDRDDEVLHEDSHRGESFLSDVAAEWEHACQPAMEAGIRVANARLGIVLDPSSGALNKMLTPAKFGGGALGDGKQWWSWVAADDVVGAIYHAICTEPLRGPFNVTSPNPVLAGQLAKTLGAVIGRPALVPAPAFALRLALGEMADELLLASARAVPDKLQRTGYAFRFSEVDSALRYCLGKDRLESTE
ncbi:TIGR01777 family protein [Roseiconus nitratireducens]|uniref:TIGR01777 family protein n=1 Tax=Roseiconus nitratireducens TaxID=2605748 RepID=A0A5M6D974_9BACT|nr:TIGR01777 family oxidoreductase [Roseiconus nitratireducens]KAA5543176.1 TIGR01777 family protein [Roseiconus nitratireducens]